VLAERRYKYNNKMSQKDSEFSFKVVLIGDPGVGKTSIILRFVDNTFIPDNVTTNGVNIKTRALQFGKKTVKLVLADTAGQERFRTVSRSIYRDADAVIIVYDQANEKSFTSLKFWLNEVEKYARENTQKFVVASKSDLNLVVPLAAGKGFAEDLHVPFFEVSAKLDVNVDVLFQTIVQSLGERSSRNEDWGKFKIIKNGSSSSSSSSNASGSAQPKRKSGFCTIL